MSSTTTNHQFTEVGSTLPEPHFDEEATILSARAVVPLEEVESPKSKASLPRPWTLGLGLVGALLVGILATAIYYSGSTGTDSNLFQVEEVAAGVEGNSAERSNSFSGPASPQPEREVNKPTEAPRQIVVSNKTDKSSAESDKKPRARLVTVITDRRNDNHIDEEGDEDRKAARKQARQERRRAERERRNGNMSDELLRIRDIFEGSPRP